MKTLETPRLRLRGFVPEDAEDLFEYARLDTVGPRAGWTPHRTLDDSRRVIEMFVRDRDVWAIELKSAGKVIGSVGLHARQDAAKNPCLELGYVLSTPYEHQGLMGEACEEILRHAFEDLEVPILHVQHFLDNDASRRLILRLGFRAGDRVESRLHDGRTTVSQTYTLSAGDYRRRKERILMHEWNLDRLYLSYDSPAFQNDLSEVDSGIARINALADGFADHRDKVAKLESYLKEEIAFSILLTKLFGYCSLRQAVASTDPATAKYLNTLSTKMTEVTRTQTLFTRWLAAYPGLPEDIEKHPFLKDHSFHLREIVEEASHTLDEKTEVLIAKLRQTGGDEWSRLQALLTSTVSVDYEGKKITLSQVRNLAYDPDPEVRRKAYLAEIQAYGQIEKPVCFAINNIKGEVNTLCDLRGFPSALDEALFKSRMKRQTLDALVSVATEYLPVFRNYLRRKGELLGHPNGLPFYDLFAPMGKSSKTFTIPEANDYILKNFGTFNERLRKMAQKAFAEGWVDYLPHEGKVGGAFCENLPPIGESRILTNFTGVFGDVITLAHELGHAYHGECIFSESILNAEYTMPVAETASTFCETIVNQAALRDARDDEERIALLESALQDYTQVIVDILSRFHFEQAVCEGRKNTVFDENELKDMMLDAQRKTYGDGLDPEYLHPYMWLCKSHYYRPSLSFYNFPYAFGLLFAKGLYAQYRKDPAGFVGKYDALLSATGKNTVEDTAKMAGIDVTGRDFWVGSLELLKEDVETFLRLTKQ